MKLCTFALVLLALFSVFYVAVVSAQEKPCMFNLVHGGMARKRENKQFSIN